MEINTLFYLSVILFTGLCFGRLMKLVKLPNVTGYLIGGLVIGPYCLKILPENFVEQMNLVSEMALAFIAFSIGSEFKISYLKKVGLTPIIIAIFEAFGAMVLVAVALVAFGFDLQLALLLGAIASATAPAATIMVVRQYKARGPVTETLLSVVALDDAAALIAFGFSFAVVGTMQNPGSGSLVMALVSPVLEIAAALILGFLLGIVFTIPLRFFKEDSNRLILTIGFVFLGSALADWLGLSSLLLCMCMGAMVINRSKDAPAVLRLVDGLTPPIFLMFFAVSGAELNITVLPTIGLVGILYVVARVVGKILGASAGAVIMKAPDTVKKYIGFTLIPQAGVAIGLSLIASQKIPAYGQTIRAVVLCATMIYELIGPAVTKVGLLKAGEIKEA